MPLYSITYDFESSGGNIEYQVTQQVQKEAETSGIEITLITTGLSLEPGVIEGTAIIDVDGDIEPAQIFETTTGSQQLAPDSTSTSDTDQPEHKPAAAPEPPEDIPRFEQNEDAAALLPRVSNTPGRGFLLHSNLTEFAPHERDQWLVSFHHRELDREDGLSEATIRQFYRDNHDVLMDNPALKIGGFHGSVEPTIQLFLVAPFTDPQDAREFAGRTESRGAMNFYRFELTKSSLVVGQSTHGPGHVDARFRAPSGDEVSSRELAYRIWYEGLDTHSHPLGIFVDGTLHRPVTHHEEETAVTTVGHPIPVETYRSSGGTPWQFGVTRHDEQLLITQARAGPEKFDPVLKRYPIESQAIGDEPLVFSHTADRRVWSEDPFNPQIQSQRSEGLLTQFLYADAEEWHLIQPKVPGDATEAAEASFEPTQLNGISVRSSILRAQTEGEMKATVEHEYRITTEALDSCTSLYALSCYEANEESIDNLQWDIADATAYEIVRNESPLR
jgi:hypothetical protein